MKIVILDGYTENPGDLSWAGFAALGEVTVYDRTTAAQVVARIGDAEAVIVNKVPITAAVLACCPAVQYIGVLATGYNVVDIAAAKEKGIVVCNIPAYGTTAVAQFVFAMLLEVCHHVGHHSDAVAAGSWTAHSDWCFWDYPLIELKDKTMGIIGFGRIGQNTAQLAKAFGMRVLAYDCSPNEAGRALADYASLDEVLAQADVISLHCPLFPDTEGMINKNTIAKMKSGVIIINTARGGLIVEQDLREALDSHKVYAAALDVVSTEPIQADNALIGSNRCLITPHIAWAPKESRKRLMDIAVDNLAKFKAGTPVNCVYE